MNLNNLNRIILQQLLMLFLLIPFSTLAQTNLLTWNYPVHQGTKEWKQLNSFTERLNSFNIPDSIMTKMTTENLVKTCLKYPYWILITSRDNNQIGYNYLKSVFNGFRELENRKDAGIELFKAYEKMHAGEILKFNTLVEQGNFSFQFTFIEMLLSQPKIVENISSENLVLLAQKALAVYEEKSIAFDKYSYHGISTSCLILSRILKLKNNLGYFNLKDDLSELEIFNDSGVSGNKELLDQVVSASKSLLKE